MGKKKKKTRYCEYWYRCDRKEDCFNGEYCPVYKFNKECSQDVYRVDEDIAERDLYDLFRRTF